MSLVVQPSLVNQPPLFKTNTAPLVMVINGLALGGAEKIVLDWAVRVSRSRPVRLVVLRNSVNEYSVPPTVDVVRLHGRNVRERLHSIGKQLVKSGQSVCLCHLLRQDERDALAEAGAVPVPVLHNAASGWLEGTHALTSTPHVVAVSDSCARDLRDGGYAGHISVIRHIPSVPKSDPILRSALRKAWRIPEQAFVIGMIGAVKPQKNYPFAMEVLKALHEHRDAYLVILGGPVGRNGKRAWMETVRAVHALGLRHRVAMPGFVPDAASCQPAFDLFLNTSHYEGFSMAIQESLLAKLPTVVRNVGGQEEIDGEQLMLVDKDAPVADWVEAIEHVLAKPRTRPKWATFSAYRLWTLATLARPFTPKPGTLFITANLNAGGAQRSLVNLASQLSRRSRFAIAVCGDSTVDYFHDRLRHAKVPTFRTASSRDPFDHAEALIEAVVSGRYQNLVFWNADVKVKLLVVKALAHTNVRVVDVSPGGYAFEEMEDAREFGRLIAFRSDAFYERVDQLVLKYAGSAPAPCAGKTVVIPNGVHAPRQVKSNYGLSGAPQIAVSGRIAPTKFLLEIIAAVKLLRATHPDAELHIYGTAEPRFADYAAEVLRAADGVAVFHGADIEAPEKLHAHDLFVVLGRHQGCPNALLEAMAAGLPCIANDDGGTAEVLSGTGVLVDSVQPEGLAAAMHKLLNDRAEAARLGNAARASVARAHSMASMRGSYTALFDGDQPTLRDRMVRCVDLISNALFGQTRSLVSTGFTATNPTTTRRST